MTTKRLLSILGAASIVAASSTLIRAQNVVVAKDVTGVRPGFVFPGTVDFTYPPSGALPTWRLNVTPAPTYRHYETGHFPTHGDWTANFIATPGGGPLGLMEPGFFECVVPNVTSPELRFQYHFRGYVWRYRGTTLGAIAGHRGTRVAPYSEPMAPWTVEGRAPGSGYRVTPTRHRYVVLGRYAEFTSYWTVGQVKAGSTWSHDPTNPGDVTELLLDQAPDPGHARYRLTASQKGEYTIKGTTGQNTDYATVEFVEPKGVVLAGPDLAGAWNQIQPWGDHLEDMGYNPVQRVGPNATHVQAVSASPDGSVWVQYAHGVMGNDEDLSGDGTFRGFQFVGRHLLPGDLPGDLAYDLVFMVGCAGAQPRARRPGSNSEAFVTAFGARAYVGFQVTINRELGVQVANRFMEHLAVGENVNNAAKAAFEQTVHGILHFVPKGYHEIWKNEHNGIDENMPVHVVLGDGSLVVKLSP